MSVKKVIAAVIVGIAPMAFADGQDQQETKRQSLAQLKARCQELQQDTQRMPFTARVTCREVRYSWVPAGEAQPVDLQNNREVGGSIIMKTYEVPYSAGAAVAAPTPVPCAKFQRVKTVIPAVDVEVNCEQLEQIKSLAEFCEPVVANRASDDGSLGQAEPTGEIYSTCSGLAKEGQKVDQK